MNRYLEQLFEHIRKKHKHLKCSDCHKNTWHAFAERKKAIMVWHHGMSKSELRRRHYACVLRAPEYYLCEYSVFECLKCGKRHNSFGTCKRISKEEAEKTDCKKLSKTAFWHLMHH